ncbi:hypothetical protein KY363_02675 [Candidatus Woesearchaeota archaeon]|nr:hypothetical protein [Candidatus Woesearchaeota archaeon]
MAESNLDSVLEQAKLGDIVMLYVPAWVQSCVSHHGIEHMAGFYKGCSDGNVRLECADRIVRVHSDEIDSAALIVPSDVYMPMDRFRQQDVLDDVLFGDCLLLNRGGGKRTVGFYTGHTRAGGDASFISLDLARKGAYECSPADFPLSGFVSYQVIDMFRPDPMNDGIDSIMMDYLIDHPKIRERCRSWCYEDD